MPEYVKALIVVLGISVAVFALASSQLTASIIAKPDYRRRCWVWVGVTAAAFLAQNFWIYAAVAGVLLLVGGRRDSNPMAFYCALLVAVPPLGAQIPGMGIINYFFELNYFRLLSLMVLLPAAWQLFSTRRQRLAGPRLPDVLLAAYLVLLFVLTAMVLPLTTALRQGFYLFIDLWLVYYVASRSVRDLASFREVAAAFVLGAAVMAVIAIFEAGRGWLLYSTLESTLGVDWGMGNYLSRGVDGPLRAMASTGHPIVTGYLMVVAIPLLMFLKPSIPRVLIWWLALIALLGGLIVTLSRGPWVGGIAMALTLSLIGKGAGKRLAWVVCGTAVTAVVALVSPWGSGLIQYLPFIGTVDSGTIDYRRQLFEVSIRILAHSPFFGDPSFYGRAAAQELVQGEGIIDMVNSYLGVAVGSGGVGLALFSGLFISAIVLLWRARELHLEDRSADDLARCLLAAIIGILVIIGTASSILLVPVIYILFAAFAVGYASAFSRRAGAAAFGLAGGPVGPAHRPHRSLAG